MLDPTVSIENSFKTVSYQQWTDTVATVLNTQSQLELEKKLNFTSVEQINLKALDVESKRTVDLISFPQKIEIISNQFGDDDHCVDVAKVHNAGASIVQELTYALNGFLKKIDHCDSLIIHMACDSLYFSNIAKIRALRFLLERLVEEGALKMNFKIYAHNSLREQTLFDPWVNMLRATTSSMSAIIGGANGISSYSYDYLYSILSGKEVSALGARQADNILKILLEESQLQRVLDPMKGSYTIDNLTEQIIEKVWSEFQNDFDEKIFIENVSKVALQRYELARKRKVVLTGVNNFANPEETLLSIYKENFEENFSLAEASSIKLTNSYPLKTVAYEFEKLRLQMNNLEASVHLILYGDEAKLSARANFCKNYFEILGVKVHQSKAGKDIDDQLQQFLDSNTKHAIFCALDDDYALDGQKMIEQIKDAGAKTIYLAGKADGLDLDHLTDRLFIGQNIYEVLCSFVREVQA